MADGAPATSSSSQQALGAKKSSSPPQSKRGKKRPRQDRPCFEWSKAGSCQYGDSCRFSHRAEDIGTIDAKTGRPKWPDNREPFGDVVRRNYTELFLRRNHSGTAHESEASEDLAESCADQYVHLHPNHLCVIGLVPKHACLQKGRKIKSFKYGSLRGLDLGVVQTSGKKKRGSLKVKCDTSLATIECDDGTIWPVVAAIEGSLIEVNDQAVNDPSIISNDPTFSGYLAIIQPKSDHLLRKNLQGLENPRDV